MKNAQQTREFKMKSKSTRINFAEGLFESSDVKSEISDAMPTPIFASPSRKKSASDFSNGEGEEERLAKAAAAGNEAAFDALVTRFTARVFAVAFHMLKDRAEAEDLTQEVFVSLYRSLRTFRFESRLSTWIYRIVKNRCLNRIQFLQRRHIGRHSDIDDPAVGHRLCDEKSEKGNLFDPSMRLERSQLSEVLEEHLNRLPPEQRLLVVLRDLEELTYEEIAELTEQPIGTVKSRIHRARFALQKSLSPFLARVEHFAVEKKEDTQNLNPGSRGLR